MQFAYLSWSGLLLLPLAVAGLAVVGLVRRRRALQRWASHPAGAALLLVAPGRVELKTALVAAAAGLLGLVLLGPQWGFHEEKGQPVAGRDLFLLLDVSRSMLAGDAAPNRLEAARQAARAVLVGLERAGGHRAALVAFADRAVLLCPLTTDFRCLEDELGRASLESLRGRSDAAAEEGTQIAAALRRVEGAVRPALGPFTDVLLLSDGGDLAGETLEAADALARLGVTVHAAGLGDPERSAEIPVPGARGEPAVLRYQGEPVHTRLEEDVLRSVAGRTGGRYVRASAGGPDLAWQVDRALAERQGRELPLPDRSRVGSQRFQWFLLPALALLVVELLLAEGRRRA